METLCNTQLVIPLKSYMIQRFPKSIKLSYETVAHKKVSSDYTLCLAIPYGRKAYLWWTYYNNKLVCCLLELNRANVIGENVSFIQAPMPHHFELGTIVSGTLLDEANHSDPHDTEPKTNTNENANTSTNTNKSFNHFVVEDMYMYKGNILNQFQPMPFQQKLNHLMDFFQCIRPLEQPHDHVYISFHHMWIRSPDLDDDTIPSQVQIPYNIRHIQYRNVSDVCPHMNVSVHKKPVWNPTIVADGIWDNIEKPTVPDWSLDYSKPHYKQQVVFWVRPDIAYDVYYLYAKDSQRNPLLYQHAFIPDYKTSVMMNGIFRFIKENRNLDFVEESDDEDMYEDVRRDKFVDLNRNVLMECVFDRKFRKWVPIRVATGDPPLEKHVPYINQLVFVKHGHQHSHNHNHNHVPNRPPPKHLQNRQPFRSRPPSHNHNYNQHHNNNQNHRTPNPSSSKNNLNKPYKPSSDRNHERFSHHKRTFPQKPE